MKKTFIISALLMAFIISANGQVRFGVHGDATVTTIKYVTDDESNSFGNYDGSRISFRAGIIAELPISERVSFMPQLNFVSGGGSLEGEITYTEENDVYKYSFEEKLIANFIELPLNIAYSMPLGNGGRFFVGAGPFVQYGIGGKYEVDGSESANGGQAEKFKEEGKVKFDGKTVEELAQDDVDVHFNAFNFGANVFAGYEFNSGLFLKAGFTHGLADINPNDEQSSKTRQFGIGIGYFLNSGR